MAGNIRVVNYTPKPNDQRPDVVTLAFFFPVANPVKLADAIAGKSGKAAAADSEDWKKASEVVAYQQSGGVAQATSDSIDAVTASLLDDAERAAVVAGELSAPISLSLALEAGEAIADLSDPATSLWKRINLMWNQANKDFQSRYQAQRAVIGLVIDEVLIDNLAKIPAELQP